ncbi:MAG TPA: OmpA family protein [Bacteroidia bacterium]|nr:OmpA family protein [Bacteroidia bacterium]
MRFPLLIIFIFCLTCLFSQKKADTLRLYYEINETSSELNYSRIDSTIKALKGRYADVAIYGFADFLHLSDYNIVLSQERALNVKNYLLKKSKPSQFNVYACEGKGEVNSQDNGNKEGEPRQRRVDVYFEPVVTINVADDKLETPQQKTPVEEKKNIEELSAGESMALEGLGFEPGRHFVLKSSEPILQKLLQTLKQNKSLKIEIQGHVCCTQNGADGMDLDTREMKLSENRAKAIYDYLISKGIPKNRLSYKGFGRTKPKYELELTPEEEQANRRVEIMILEK